MNALTAELVPYIHALGWSLLHFLWQGALIGLGYALMRGSCASSTARHRLGMFCLVAMLACPLVTLAVLPLLTSGSSTGLQPSIRRFPRWRCRPLRPRSPSHRPRLPRQRVSKLGCPGASAYGWLACA